MDEYIDIKDKLMMYRYYKDELDFLKSQIEEMERRITGINSTSVIQMDDGNGIKKYLNDYVSELVDMKKEYERRYIESLKKWKDVRDFINQLKDPLERRILFAYYCDCGRTSLFSISKKWNYSREYLQNKHSSALRHLRQISEKKERVG